MDSDKCHEESSEEVKQVGKPVFDLEKIPPP